MAELQAAKAIILDSTEAGRVYPAPKGERE